MMYKIKKSLKVQSGDRLCDEERISMFFWYLFLFFFFFVSSIVDQLHFFNKVQRCFDNNKKKKVKIRWIMLRENKKSVQVSIPSATGNKGI